MNSLQEEEITALKAIYDHDFCTTDDSGARFTIKINCSDPRYNDVALVVWFPEDYPTQAPPKYELKGEWRTAEDDEEIYHHFMTIFSVSGGEVVVYQWVEWLRDFLEKKDQLKAQAQLQAQLKAQLEAEYSAEGESCDKEATTVPDEENIMSTNSAEFLSYQAMQQTTSTDTPYLTTAVLATAQGSNMACAIEIIHGEPMTDRKSTFQAHVAAVQTVAEVKAMVAQLKETKKIAAATHNILAYRLVDVSGLLRQDCDDDGEAAAGGRLLHLLQIMNAQNVVVVVTRWYGGILLHSDRFKHINNVARILLQESGIGLMEKEVQLTKQKSTKKKSKTKN